VASLSSFTSDTEHEILGQTFETPSLRSLFVKGLPAIIESTIVPLAIFYAALWVVGMWGALIAALAWSYLVVLCRLVRKEPISGLAILGALALTFRTALAMVTGNVVLYFLQPSLGTALVGLAFLVSMRTKQPLIQRLARDFLPDLPEFFSIPSVRRFFLKISPLWALMMLGNAAVTIWMLFALPVSVFVISRTLVSGALIAATMAYSVMGLRSLLSGSPVRPRASRPRQLAERRRLPRLPLPAWGLCPQFAIR
jgi:intracellular septation protein A